MPVPPLPHPLSAVKEPITCPVGIPQPQLAGADGVAPGASLPGPAARTGGSTGLASAPPTRRGTAVPPGRGWFHCRPGVRAWSSRPGLPDPDRLVGHRSCDLAEQRRWPAIGAAFAAARRLRPRGDAGGVGCRARCGDQSGGRPIGYRWQLFRSSDIRHRSHVADAAVAGQLSRDRSWAAGAPAPPAASLRRRVPTGPRPRRR
jgi:hypothetical protein